MSLFKKLALTTTAAAVVLLAAACADGDEDAKASPAAGQPQTLTNVSAGYLPIFVYAPFFVAIEKGYFEEEGIELELKALQGGGQILTQVAAGNLDTGAGGIGPAAMNLSKEYLDRGEKKLPFVIVAPLHIERPPLLTSVVTSTKNFDSGAVTKVSDLKGKKVATNDKGAATGYWIALALQKAGLTFKDLAGGEPVEVGFSAMPAALERGDIDAAILGEPLLSAAVNAGQVKVIANDFLDGEPGTSVFLNRAWAEKNPKLAQGYVNALLKAFRDLQGDGWKDEVNLRIIARYTNAEDTSALKSYNRPYYDPNGAFDVEKLSKHQQYYLANSKLLTYSQPLDLKLMVDAGYAANAVKALGEAKR